MPVLPEASQLLFQSRRVEARDSVVYPESTFFHFIARFRAAERPKVAAKSESRCVLGGVFFFRSSLLFFFLACLFVFISFRYFGGRRNFLSSAILIPFVSLLCLCFFFASSLLTVVQFDCLFNTSLSEFISACRAARESRMC